MSNWFSEMGKREQIPILKTALSDLEGTVFLEFVVPRAVSPQQAHVTKLFCQEPPAFTAAWKDRPTNCSGLPNPPTCRPFP
jgi:hypothetical protein